MTRKKVQKSRFFREQSEVHECEINSSKERLYVGPFSKSSKKFIEISSDPEVEEEDTSIHYYRKEGPSLFTSSRKDLPQYFIDPRIRVQMTPTMGKGCFALEDIQKNTLIESAPIILVHRDTFGSLNEINGGTHKFSEYPFSWGRDGLCAIALGYGGIYNHKVNKNVTWRPSYEMESIQFTTCKDISAGEELFIRYLPIEKLGDLWFEDEESQNIADDSIVSLSRENLGDIKSWQAFKDGYMHPKFI